MNGKEKARELLWDWPFKQRQIDSLKERADGILKDYQEVPEVMRFFLVGVVELRVSEIIADLMQWDIESKVQGHLSNYARDTSRRLMTTVESLSIQRKKPTRKKRGHK